MFGLDAPELIVIAIVVLVLFGSKKLPEAARSLGRSMRIFKAETREMRADDAAAIEPAPPVVAAPPSANGSVETPVAAPVSPQPPSAEPHAGSDPR